jgi:fatty acid desaturase
MGVIRTTTPRTNGGAASGPNLFTDLASQIHSSGLMRRRYGYYWSKIGILFLLLAGTLSAFVWIGDTWWQLLTAAFLACLFAQAAFLGHDAAHRQIFVSGRWNNWMSMVIGDLMVGMSFGWWQHKHTRHHANPNKIGSDPDIELPVIAVTAETAQRDHGLFLTWLRAHQGIVFFPLLLFEGVSLHASSVRRVLTRGHLEHRAVEIIFLSVRLVGFFALVFLVLSPGIAAAFIAVQLGIFGFHMGMAFAPNHKGMPIVPHSLRLDFLRRQVMMSRNIRGTRLLDFLMGGLNYQIEHHLFPSMPRPHLRTAAPLIADYCRRVGVAYTQTGLFESYAIVVRYINRVGLGERDVFTCPLVEQRSTGR